MQGPKIPCFPPWGVCGINPDFSGLSPSAGQIPALYSPVRRSTPESKLSSFPLDLHVLGLPPAFNLSHDQTLQFRIFFLPHTCRNRRRQVPSIKNPSFRITGHGILVKAGFGRTFYLFFQSFHPGGKRSFAFGKSGAIRSTSAHINCLYILLKTHPVASRWAVASGVPRKQVAHSSDLRKSVNPLVALFSKISETQGKSGQIHTGSGHNRHGHLWRQS